MDGPTEVVSGGLEAASIASTHSPGPAPTQPIQREGAGDQCEPRAQSSVNAPRAWVQAPGLPPRPVQLSTNGLSGAGLRPPGGALPSRPSTTPLWGLDVLRPPWSTGQQGSSGQEKELQAPLCDSRGRGGPRVGPPCKRTLARCTSRQETRPPEDLSFPTR